jgi:transposase-like protein
METRQRKNILIHINDIIERIKMPKGNKNYNCPNCGSRNTRTHCKRICINFVVQRYKCLDCLKYFCDRDPNYLRMKNEDSTVKHAIILFQKGYSSRQISNKLGVDVKHTSIIEWIKKFVKNPNFQVNASDRQEVRDKISLTLRGR